MLWVRKRLSSSSSRGSSKADDILSSDSISHDDGKSEINDHAHLSPKEAFLKFDADSSGDIDEDEFFHLLESVGIKGKLEYQEKLFRRYVKAGSNTIDYESFKSAWLLLGNPKQELLDRGVKDIPKFATRYALVRLLEKTLDDEERLAALATAEADRYRRLQEVKSHRSGYIERAKARAGLELAAALDAAGQVYVLGTGAHGQFSAAPKKDFSTASFRQVGAELMQSLWEERVGDNGHLANGNTAGIWGRRPRKVALTDNAILALTDSGILSWGGTFNWHSLSDTVPRKIASRQRTPTQTTPRSSALLMNNERMHRKHMAVIQEETNEQDARTASEMQMMETTLKYYGQWPAHFDGTNDVEMVREHLLARIAHDCLLHSLLLRGKPCEGTGLSKLDMADMLTKDLRLEKEVLGDAGQKELCDMEFEINDLAKRKQTKSANILRLKFSEKWAPLLQLGKERAIAEEQRMEAERKFSRSKQTSDYESWHARRVDSERSSLVEHNDLLAGSITTRGGDIRTPRGVSQCLDIDAGSNHAAIVVRDERSRGSLYTWGVSSLGRLGHGEQSKGDLNHPIVVEQLKGTSIASVSLGQCHSAAVSNSGALFVWGAGSSGQLGFGTMADGQGFCCTVPTKLLIPSCKVRKVSCGACHTACIGSSGELYVWGLGDGGRLGLGRLATQHTPVLVESLSHERISDVSCGTSTTLLLTETKDVGTNSRTGVKRITGGRVYVAGPKNVLGASFPTFGELECLKENAVVAKSISAGYSHQSIVSESGELYCWGHNLHGCCGQEESTRFIPEPTKVKWLYEAPRNLALGKTCRLSSLYKDSVGLSACNGVDGNIDGNDVRKLAHTQFEAQPHFDVDLGEQVQVTHVRLWNRTDEPDDGALPVDFYSKRLFPCVVMISQFPFPTDLDGKDGLDVALKQSIANITLSEDKRMSHWDVPKFTVGRYVRIQLEGTNFLHFAQLEVFGHEKRSQGPIASCTAGKFVTTAVVSGIDDRRGIETAYKRALWADWYNAEILRQLSCYSDEYRKETNAFDSKAKCLLCVGDQECEICTLKTTFGRELQGIMKSGESYRLEDLATHLLSAANIELSDATKGSSSVVDAGAKDRGKKTNILPVLLKMKHRHSMIRQQKKASSQGEWKRR